MFCTKCGKEIPEGSTFCPSCGKEIKAPSSAKGLAHPSEAPATPPAITPPFAPQPSLAPTKRKKLSPPLLGGIIAAAVALVALILVLTLVVFAGEKTLSKKEYKQKAGDVQDATIDSLNDFDKELSNLNKMNSTMSKASDLNKLLVELSKKCDDATGKLEEGVSQLETLKPPKEAKSLNQDLVSYHKESGEKFKGFKSTITYFENLTQVLASEDFVKAQEEIDQASGNVQQLIDVLTKHKATIGIMVGKLKAITPPEELKKTHEDLTTLWEEMEKLYGELIAALQTMDLARAQRAESQARSMESRYNDILSIYQNAFKDMQTQTKAIIHKAEELMKQIEALV